MVVLIYYSEHCMFCCWLWCNTLTCGRCLRTSNTVMDSPVTDQIWPNLYRVGMPYALENASYGHRHLDASEEAELLARKLCSALGKHKKMSLCYVRFGFECCSVICLYWSLLVEVFLLLGLVVVMLGLWTFQFSIGHFGMRVVARSWRAFPCDTFNFHSENESET